MKGPEDWGAGQGLARVRKLNISSHNSTSYVAIDHILTAYPRGPRPGPYQVHIR